MQQAISKKRQERGLSLIELIIYFALFSILITLVAKFLFDLKTLQLETQSHLSLNREARFLFLEIQKSLRSAQSIDSPAPGETGDSLSLNGGEIIYSLTPEGILEKTNLSGTFPLHSSKVSIHQLSFTRSADLNQKENIQIQMELKSQRLLEGKREKSLSLQTTISLR